MNCSPELIDYDVVDNMDNDNTYIDKYTADTFLFIQSIIDSDPQWYPNIEIDVSTISLHNQCYAIYNKNKIKTFSKTFNVSYETFVLANLIISGTDKPTTLKAPIIQGTLFDTLMCYISSVENVLSLSEKYEVTLTFV